MPPINVMIKPVSGCCNMRCRYCFYADELTARSEPPLPPMTVETLHKVIRRVMNFADQQVSFVFQGGEPTLAGGAFFRQAVALQKQYNARGLTVSNMLQTNGLMLEEALIDLLAREHFLVGISLDGCASVHDLLRPDASGHATFGRVMANARRLLDAGVEVNVLCVVTGEIARHADEVLDVLAPFRYLQFIPCLEPLNGASTPYSLQPQAYAEFLHKAFERYERAFQRGKPLSIRLFDNLLDMILGYGPENCAMRGHCSTNLIIESNGDVYPCDFYCLPEWRLGNITREPLRAILQAAPAQAFRARSMPVPSACQACRWYALCRNGCYRERDAEGRFRWCDAMKPFLDQHASRLQAMAKALTMQHT